MSLSVYFFLIQIGFPSLEDFAFGSFFSAYFYALYFLKKKCLLLQFLLIN